MARNVLKSSKVIARHSHLIPPRPSSSLATSSPSMVSSCASVSLSTASDILLRLLARDAAFAFFEFFFAFVAGGGGGGGSV